MMNRREMIALGFVGGVAAATGLPELFGETPGSDSGQPAEISNRHMRVRFDAESGRIHSWLGGVPVLRNVTSRMVGSTWAVATSDQGLVRRARTEKIDDALGRGRRIVAECLDRRRKLTLGVGISLYDEREALLVECWCKNGGSAPLALKALEPLRAVPDEQGFIEWSSLGKVLRNGFLYADPGMVEDFYTSRHYAHSGMWNMGFSSTDPKHPALSVGFIESEFATGRLEASSLAFEQRDGMSLVAEALLNREFVVKPGEAARSGRFALQVGADAFQALERYAQMMGDAHRVRLNTVINGWCPWFYAHTTPTEEEILKNADFAAKHLKPYGMEFIQIDDGYQRAFSDWEGNEKFPHGMKWLAGEIRARGLRPGLWVAPYVISEGSDIHRSHPDWLLRNLDGSIKHCGNRGTTKLYGLDISVPAAQEWFRKLFLTLGNEWGYEFIKIDFVEWTILSAKRYADPSWSRAMAYRKGAEITREALGPERHILDCGPAQMTTGLIDSTRIELDLPTLNWEQYTGNFNSTGPAMAKRYYFHKRTWINDADHIGLALLTPTQAMAAASLIGLSGGTVISGDRLIELDDLRLAILQKILPAYGEAARPIDLFEREKPEIFSLKVTRPFEEWLVVGLFNYELKAAMEKSVALERLGLDAGQKWLGFDFWGQQFLGSVRGEARTLVPPASVALIALRKDTGHPQVLSTSRHYTQGGVELRDVLWDEATKTLRGVSLGGAETQHDVFIHLPNEYALTWDEPEVPHEFDGYSVTLMQEGVVRVHVNGGKSTEISWNLKFRQLAS